MVYQIVKNDQGWYDFSRIPQGYFKTYWLNCKTDQKALAQAKKLSPNASFEIVNGDEV